MKSGRVLILCVVIFAVNTASSDEGSGQNAPEHESASGTDPAVPAGTCSITGYRTVAQATTPAYLPGQTTRQSELGAQLKFPLAALGYDPATQRFTVALSTPGAATADQEGTEVELIELRRKHVDFEGDSCPGQTENGGSIRCFETTTLASRGSNPVYCQKDSNETPE
jgi:hypothetical protein